MDQYDVISYKFEFKIPLVVSNLKLKIVTAADSQQIKMSVILKALQIIVNLKPITLSRNAT